MPQPDGMDYAIQIVRDCRRCEGRGWIGYWYCSKCGLQLAAPTPTANCSHPPDCLTDDRRLCDECKGSGRVPDSATLRELAGLLWNSAKMHDWVCSIANAAVHNKE